MSKATPMGSERRIGSYGSKPWDMTPRQGRRFAHKLWREGDATARSYTYTNAKGYTTPRRANAIEGKRAMRRFLEVTRARKAAEQAASG